MNSFVTMTAEKFLIIKKQLKSTGLLITENPIAGRMWQLKNARDQFGFNNVWSIDGRIMYRDTTSTKTKLFYG